MATKPPDMQTIPAPLGYFALSYFESEDGFDVELTKTAIIAWCIDQEDPECVWPFPVMLDPLHGALAILRPDGVVEGNQGDCDYPSVEVWLETKRLEHFKGKVSRLARLATKGGSK